jgi:hypothetical protein
MQPIASHKIMDVLAAYPGALRKRVLFLRGLIFDVASKLKGFPPLEEFLFLGEPIYRIAQSRHAIKVRISRKNRRNRLPTEYALQFRAKVDIISTFRTLFPSTFRYEGNSIVFDEGDAIPVKELRVCLFMALTHHRRRKAADMRRVASRRQRLSSAQNEPIASARPA